MEQNVSRRRVSRALAWSVPTVAGVAAAPLAAASEPAPTPTDPTPPVDPDPPAGACECGVDWTAAAQRDLAAGGIEHLAVKKDDCGYFTAHGWGTDPLSWRIPFGTTHALEAGTTLVVEPTGGTGAFVEGSVRNQTGTGEFARVTTQTERFLNAPTGQLSWHVDQGRLVIVLPAMPADSHAMVTVTAARTAGATTAGVTATATGAYTAAALQVLGCS